MPKLLDVDNYYWGVRKPRHSSVRTHSNVILDDNVLCKTITSYRAQYAGEQNEHHAVIQRGSCNKYDSQVELAFPRPSTVPDPLISTSKRVYDDPTDKAESGKFRILIRPPAKINLCETEVDDKHYKTTTKLCFEHNESLKLRPPMRNMWNRTASKVILSNNPWITELMATQDAGQGDTKKLQTNVIDKAKDKPTTQKKAAKNNSQSKDRVHFDVQSVRTTASQVMYKTDHVKTELDNLKPARGALGNKTESMVDLSSNNFSAQVSHSHEVHCGVGQPRIPPSSWITSRRRQHSNWHPTHDLAGRTSGRLPEKYL